MTKDETVDSVLRLADGFGVPLARQAAEGIVEFLDELLRWNRHVNLTGHADLRELLGKHVPDSFLVAGLCPPGSRVVDVGSGGGLPAIPFALARPDCTVTLVEPRAKRVAFLRTAVRLVGLEGAKVVRARADELPEGGFDVAVSRATFAPEEWLEVAKRLVGIGGRAVVLSAREVAVVGPGTQLEHAVPYEAGSAPRWAGVYRFT